MSEQTLIPKQNITDLDATSKWAKKRKLLYLLLTVIVLIIFGVFSYFKFIYTPPSCFDGKQDQKEVGVDCGGPCDTLCGTQVSDIIVKWVKVFKVSDGIYSVAASVENPNKLAGVGKMSFNFKIYDDSGNIIGDRSGNTFIKPHNRFMIFEPNILPKNGSIPVSATISFDKSSVWKVMQYKNMSVLVKNKKLANVLTHPILTATLLNDSIDSLFNLNVVAVVYNSKDKPIAVSSTFVSTIGKNSQKNIFFTWPTPFTIAPKAGCTTPVDAVLVFDRSGSMGFAGSNPPQPITDAKNAALEFIKNMQKEDKIGLVSFATTASSPIDQKLTNLHDKVEKAVESISILSPSRQQHTNLGDGIDKATKELLSQVNDKNIKKAIVILTDGVASRPLNPKDSSDAKYPSNYAHDKALIAIKSGISIYAIGLGKDIKEGFLKNEIVSSSDNYFKASDVSELKDIYHNIAKAICKEEAFTTDIIVHYKNISNNQI